MKDIKEQVDSLIRTIDIHLDNSIDKNYIYMIDALKQIRRYAVIIQNHIEQAKKDKLTLQECKDKIARDRQYNDWESLRIAFTTYDGLHFLESSYNDTAEMYVNQFIPVASAEFGNLSLNITWTDEHGVFKLTNKIGDTYKGKSEELADFIMISEESAVPSAGKEMKTPAEQWISVKDRLPEVGQDCIVYTKSTKLLCTYVHLDDEVGYVFVPIGYNYEIQGDSGVDQTEIIGWMPLPGESNIAAMAKVISDEQIYAQSMIILSEIGAESTPAEVAPLVDDPNAVLKLKYCLQCIEAMGIWMREQLTGKP